MTLRALLALSGLLAVGTVAADERPAPYNAILGSYLSADGLRDGRAGYGATSIFGFSLARGLNLELSGFGNVIDRKSDGGTDGIIGVGADLQVLLSDGRIQTFVIGGGGVDYERLGTAADRKTYAPFGDAGFGAIARLTRNLGLRAEARGYYVFNDSAYPGSDPLLDLRVNLGLQYAFGTVIPATVDGDDDHDGVRNSIDRCPGTPAGTAVDRNGCPLPPPVKAPPPAPEVTDSDGDGVADIADQCPGTPLGVKVDAKGCPLVLDSDGDGVPDTLDRCPGTPLGFKVDAQGCIVEQTVVLKTVNFDFGSDKLTSDAKTTLDQVAKSLATQPTLRVEIAGHTDSLGPQAINLTLSEKRSIAVKSYLVAHGVAAERLRAEGYGEFNPIATNETEEGRARNRRVEFKVLNRNTAK